MKATKEEIAEAQEKLDILIKKHGFDKTLKEWTILIKDNHRGWCHPRTKFISIPLWAIQGKGRGYFEYYLCHEVSHALAGGSANHGPKFMEKLIEICPSEYLHYELNYKPRNAASAGIRRPA